MLVFDFFSGTGSSTKAFKDAGHRVISFELDDYFEATEHVDVTTLSADYLLETYGRPDFVWASPPCTTFSIAGLRHYWHYVDGKPTPKNEKAIQSLELVIKTKALIQELQPTKGWLIENPRGLLRKLDVMQDLDRETITYCQYGDTRMKPTDLWGEMPNWKPRPMCKPRSDCHEAAPRGSQAGTQGLGRHNKHGAKLRSMVAPELSAELLEALTK